jgi:predicted DNA-binding WGR domain protein
MDCHKYSYYVCIIPDRNKKAFYELFAGKDLFGFILIRRWGRISTKGQPGKKQRFHKQMGMLKEYERIRQERINRGYVQVNQTYHKIMNNQEN